MTGFKYFIETKDRGSFDRGHGVLSIRYEKNKTKPIVQMITINHNFWPNEDRIRYLVFHKRTNEILIIIIFCFLYLIHRKVFYF